MVSLFVSFMSAWCVQCTDTRHLQSFGFHRHPTSGFTFFVCPGYVAMLKAQPYYGFDYHAPTMTVNGVNLNVDGFSDILQQRQSGLDAPMEWDR